MKVHWSRQVHVDSQFLEQICRSSLKYSVFVLNFLSLTNDVEKHLF